MGFIGDASDFQPQAESLTTTPAPPGLTAGDLQAVGRLMRAVQARDAEAARHAQRVAAVCALLAERLACPRDEVWLIWVAAHLHDVGKLEVDRRILQRPGPLTPESRRVVERHALAGQRMLSWRSSSSLFQTAALIARSHHERFDGSGYPFGLAGGDIPFVGRIAAVADVFDALLSDRPYRPALELSDAVEVLAGGRDTQFDPAVLDALLGDLPEAVMIRSGFGESTTCAEAHSVVGDLLAAPA
jgi:two-component system, response regulator RpfG